MSIVLCERDSDGIEVTMTYDEKTGCEISVQDARTETDFILTAGFDGKLAMDMYRHPFAYMKAFDLQPVHSGR